MGLIQESAKNALSEQDKECDHAWDEDDCVCFSCGALKQVCGNCCYSAELVDGNFICCLQTSIEELFVVLFETTSDNCPFYNFSPENAEEEEEMQIKLAMALEEEDSFLKLGDEVWDGIMAKAGGIKVGNVEEEIIESLSDEMDEELSEEDILKMLSDND